MLVLAVEAHDVKPGVVYQDPNVKVTAFQNAHGEWKKLFGYRFDTADRLIAYLRRHEPQRRARRALPEVRHRTHEVYADSYRPAAVPDWLEDPAPNTTRRHRSWRRLP